MFTNQWLGIFEGAVQHRQGVHAACIAKGDRDVAQVPASLGAFNGTPLEALVKFTG